MALAQIAWPAAIRNITPGPFTNRVAPEKQHDNDINGSSSNTDIWKTKLIEKPYQKVTMWELPLRRLQEAIIEIVGNIKHVVYLSVDQFLRSM